MNFIYMVFHYPAPAHRDELARAMNARRDLLSSTPGCIQVDPPYVTADGECLVGISKWESRDAFDRADLTLGAPDWIPEGETRSRVRFFLSEVSLPNDSVVTRTP